MLKTRVGIEIKNIQMYILGTELLYKVMAGGIMSIKLFEHNNELILKVDITKEMNYMNYRIAQGEKYAVKKVFTVQFDLLRDFSDDGMEDSLYFCIGRVEDNYTYIDSRVLGTEHRFYFANDIMLKPRMFIAERGISIPKSIDNLIDRDLYVGGDWEAVNGIPLELYERMINLFPTSTELYKYAYYRIANIIKDFFLSCDKYKDIYEKYIEKRGNASDEHSSKYNLRIQRELFLTAFNELNDMLTADCYPENVWRDKVNHIIRLIYPQYICYKNDVCFDGIEEYDKKPDYLVVDTKGFIDIIEIKTPKAQILTCQASYRHNYVPVREFAGAVQQIEKYIYCLNTIDRSRKKVLKALKPLLPVSIEPKVLNPKGILLMGRSTGFDAQQERDFELIKRQYNNIVDILTYDDLLDRLNNIIISLNEFAF